MLKKKISIRQLHDRTGFLVRKAREGSLLITDHGKPIAILQPFIKTNDNEKAFETRKLSDLVQPRKYSDSTLVISAMRDER